MKKGGDFLCNMYLLPVVNRRARRILRDAGVTNVQLLPMSIHYGGQPLDHDYMLANVIGIADIIDWEQSERQPVFPDHPEYHHQFLKLVPRPESIPGRDWFWMERPRRMIVSGRLAQRLIMHKVTGIRLTMLTEYRDE